MGSASRLAAAALVATALLGPARAPAAEPFVYTRYLELASRGTGLWSGKMPVVADEGEVVGFSVVADWWGGPEDTRPGDEKRAPREGFVYEVRRGDGAWTALPAAARDLRLLARAAAPPEAKGLLAGAPSGDWAVRQAAGGDFPRAVRLELRCRTEPFYVLDLRVASVRLQGLEPAERPGRPYIPDRTEMPALAAGAEVVALVTVENCGARATREVDLDVGVVPFGSRKGEKRLGFVQVPPLEPGATKELTVKGKLPADLAAGASEVLATVDPRAVQREIETWNNSLGRAFLSKGLDRPKVDDDLRNR